MPVRVVLNTAYALRVRDMDADERRKFDDELYGYAEVNQRATRALFLASGDGARPDGGGASQ